MKTRLPVSAPPLLALQCLPVFFWVEREPAPVWTAAQSGTNTGRVQAVGIATAVGGDRFVAWGSTDALLMGGANTTAADDRRVVVRTA